MIKQLFAFFPCLLLLVTCGPRENSGRGFSSSKYYGIRSVDGNVITLNNNLDITLLGVENNQEVESFLKSLDLPRVKVVFDQDHPPRRISAHSTIYGYVIGQNNIHFNALLLKEGISKLNEFHLSDSLFVFKKYAGLRTETGNRPRNEVTTPDRNRMQENAALLSETTFKIDSFDEFGNNISLGSGFFLASEGLAVSNYHVFEGGQRWKTTRCSDGKTDVIDEEDIIAYSAKFDYILFRSSLNKNKAYLKVASKSPKQGDEILVYGNPKGLECTLSKGIVSAIRSSNRKNDYIQIDAAISPGSSGGPIINTKGEVIGIATLKVEDCENCNFGININLLKKHL